MLLPVAMVKILGTSTARRDLQPELPATMRPSDANSALSIHSRMAGRERCGVLLIDILNELRCPAKGVICRSQPALFIFFILLEKGRQAIGECFQCGDREHIECSWRREGPLELADLWICTSTLILPVAVVGGKRTGHPTGNTGRRTTWRQKQTAGRRSEQSGDRQVGVGLFRAPAGYRAARCATERGRSTVCISAMVAQQVALKEAYCDSP